MNKPKPVQYRSVVFFMRVTIVQILITGATLMLGYAYDTSGQEILDRRVTLEIEKKEIKEVLARIEGQIDVKFTYRPRLINARRVVSLTTQDLRLKELLTGLFEGNIDMSVIGNQIILKPLNAPTMIASRTPAANVKVDRRITGRIVDAENAPVPGVNIQVKGTSIGTTSDADGNYALDVPDDNDVLVFSFIGYITQEVNISNRTTVDVTLQTDVQQLSEVVVVGYGEQKKATVTGSVTSVKGDVITQAPVTNLSNALAGRLPGVVFVNRSGEPGYDGSQIRIRGTNTIGDPSALIVIDGIANRSGGLERLNPADIESITVLKDASAAIYGAQAANGVILVTTKRGKSGKPEINFNYNLGFNKPTRLPEVTDAATYATMLNEIDEYRSRPQRYSAEDIQKFRDGSDPWRYPDTDWYGAVIKPTSMQDNLNLSISGGTQDGVKYFVSLGSLSEDGYYKNSATKYKQYNFRSNIDAKITDWLNVAVDLAGRQESRNFPTRGAGTIFRMLIRGKPTLPAYWPNGMPGPDIENGDNPVVISTEATGTDKDNNYVFQSNLRAKIDVPWVKNLNVVLNASFDEGFRPRTVFATPWYLYTWDYTSYDSNGEPVLVKSQRGLSAPQLTEYFDRTSGNTQNAYVNYSKDFGRHALSLMAGVERQVLKGNSFNAFRNAYISSSLPQLFAGSRNESTTNDNDKSKIYSTARLNYFGRINYSYSEKYLLEMVWRYDASYIFPEDKRWGFFPGFSAGWVISEEGFMQGTDFINRLKIRGSWGQLGNDRMNSNVRDDEYQFLSSFDFGGGYIFNYTGLQTSIYPLSVPNPDITWEVANNSNIGFEGSVFQGRISFEFDYFSNKRSQMLINRSASVPATAGFVPPRENLGELVNRGVDFLVAYNGKIGNDFSFTIGANGGYSKNKIVFWDEAPGAEPWQASTGRPVGSGLYYNAIGVFKDQAAVDAYPHWPGARPGDIIFEDVNGDGVIDAKDRVRNEQNNIPRFQGGITINADYKGFDLAILFQGASGARQYIRTQSGDFGNYLQDFADKRWTTENPNSEHPRTFNREDEYWISQANTYWYRSTDYVRLKNVQLGYSISPDITKRVGMKGARIYVNAINLLTIDSFKVFDPETDNQDGTVYPQKRAYNVGVNITF